MLEPSTPLEPELAEYATLDQAVEWIAFGLPPLTSDYRMMSNSRIAKINHGVTYDEKQEIIESSKKRLFIALKQSKLNASSTITKYKMHLDDEGFDKCWFYYSGDKPRIKRNALIDFKELEFNQINFAGNRIATANIYNERYYKFNKKTETEFTDISIELNDLYNLFPLESAIISNTTPEVITLGTYTTPYMDLMQRAIKALKITKTNQPVKKIITGWLEDNNTDKSLSQREIDYLATFIRLPEMKAGGAIGLKNKPKGVTHKHK